jgi:hypothetical protein
MPETNNTKSPDQLDNEKSLSTYYHQKQTIKRAAHSKEDQLNEPANLNGDQQSSSRGSFQETTLFFLLLLRDSNKYKVHIHWCYCRCKFE